MRVLSDKEVIIMNKYFKNALPIWRKDDCDEVNSHIRLRASVNGKGKTTVKIAVCDAYHLFVNGKFVAAGPARCAKDFFRVDEIDISKEMKDGESYVAVIAVGYNAASYQYARGESFITCEIEKDGGVIAATGAFGFTAGLDTDYVRQTNRYSFQRTFTEVVRLGAKSDEWKTGGEMAECETVVLGEKAYLDRNVRYPEYEVLTPKAIAGGEAVFREPEKRTKLWYSSFSAKDYFTFEEPYENVYKELEEIGVTRGGNGTESVIKQNRFVSFEFDHNATGFVSADIKSFGNAVVYVLYDEILSDGKVNGARSECTNALKYYLGEGECTTLTLEPYTMKYATVCVFGADIELSGFRMIEYKHPPVTRSFTAKNEKIQKVYDAAVETFRQNALDIFMDCPSRERAGWLCDSFFTARAETFLCGESKVEENFLENFFLPDSFDHLPKDMFPMCYPGTQTDGQYIPNWSMWLVLEIHDYTERCGSRVLAERFKSKIYKLIDFFRRFENEDGLLKNLESWVFVDWSASNTYTKGINYPSNMMYAYMCECAGELYSDASLIEKSEKIRAKVRDESYNGEYFVDHRIDGVDCSDHISEACQYYAFFTKTATKDTYPELWTRIETELGPNIDSEKVKKANAFIGNYLRLVIFEREKCWRRILDETLDYFYYMAARTGTLWEKINTQNSLNHGFASYAAVLIHNATEALYGEDK